MPRAATAAWSRSRAQATLSTSPAPKRLPRLLRRRRNTRGIIRPARQDRLGASGRSLPFEPVLAHRRLDQKAQPPRRRQRLAPRCRHTIHQTAAVPILTNRVKEILSHRRRPVHDGNRSWPPPG